MTLPWTEALEAQFTFESAYDGPIQVFRKHANAKWIDVPRGAVPCGGEDYRDIGVAIDFNTTLFKAQKPEQDEVIADTVALLKAGKQFTVSAPTGWGKTYVGSQVIGLMGVRACVVTTKSDIVVQWRQALRDTLGLTDDEIGVWSGDLV